MYSIFYVISLVCFSIGFGMTYDEIETRTFRRYVLMPIGVIIFLIGIGLRFYE